LNILGINISHDASLALVQSGKLVGAISIERFSRIKKDSHISMEHINTFLSSFGLNILDIDVVTFSFFIQDCVPFIKIYSPFDKIYPFSSYGSHSKQGPLLNHLKDQDRVEHVDGKGYTLPNYITRLRPPYSSDPISQDFSFPIKVEFDGIDKLFEGYLVDHQIAHAASAYYTSNFEQSAIFTADASMHDATACSMWWMGYDRRITPFRCPEYMLGNFYDVATEFCGLGVGTLKAGSLMGLSSHGSVSEKTKKNWKEWTKPLSERTESEDHLYIDWLFSQISGKFPKVGEPIPEVEDEVAGYQNYTRPYQQVYTKEESDKQECMDVAASIQYITERSLVHYTNKLFEESEGFNLNNLCLSGGIFLNCNANYKILKETNFKNIHLYPACGDDGVATGSALYIYHHILENQRERTYLNKELMYTGIDYNIPANLKVSDFEFLAEELSKGKIVCWHQGRSEFGPRSLGNRSFLADPRDPKMKDILNKKVKFREWYRPFAPVVLKEYCFDWFDLDVESPFMLYTVPCKKPEQIPSACHVDNSSRVQTIEKFDNPNLYDLIWNFKQITGVPILINTSLNVKGEPIVETEEDSIKLFEESDVDILVLNGKITKK